MKLFAKPISAKLLPVIALCYVTPVFAQLDRVYDKAEDNVVGTIVNVTKNGVSLKRGDNTQEFQADQTLKILYEGDPPALTKGREFALDSQFAQALSELKTISLDSLPRDVNKADTIFYLAYCEAKLALAGKGAKDEAVGKLLTFARNYGQSWHFYEAAKLLGDLSLALNDADKAATYYKSLMNAPSANIQIESVYLQGLVNLKKQESDAATTEFEKVIGLKAQSATVARLQVLAKAGKALALAQSKKGKESLEITNQLIADLNPTDVEMAARIYNAQGAGYEASGDTEGAILAYLHTHLMFSLQPDAHAQALQRLAELWPQVGKPERAAEARQELQQRYPGF